MQVINHSVALGAFDVHVSISRNMFGERAAWIVFDDDAHVVAESPDLPPLMFGYCERELLSLALAAAHTAASDSELEFEYIDAAIPDTVPLCMCD